MGTADWLRDWMFFFGTGLPLKFEKLSIISLLPGVHISFLWLIKDTDNAWQKKKEMNTDTCKLAGVFL